MRSFSLFSSAVPELSKLLAAVKREEKKSAQLQNIFALKRARGLALCCFAI